jgi:putative transposase
MNSVSTNFGAQAASTYYYPLQIRQPSAGPKGPSQELIHAIVELKRRNPRFGYPRIARIISKTLGIEIDRNVVRRVLAKYYHPENGRDGPAWLTFIGFAVHAGDVNGLILCRMFNKIVTGITPPKYLSSDNDPLF